MSFGRSRLHSNDQPVGRHRLRWVWNPGVGVFRSRSMALAKESRQVRSETTILLIAALGMCSAVPSASAGFWPDGDATIAEIMPCTPTPTTPCNPAPTTKVKVTIGPGQDGDILQIVGSFRLYDPIGAT